VFVDTATQAHIDSALSFSGNTNVVLQSNLDKVHNVATI